MWTAFYNELVVWIIFRLHLKSAILIVEQIATQTFLLNQFPSCRCFQIDKFSCNQIHLHLRGKGGYFKAPVRPGIIMADTIYGSAVQMC